MKGILNISGVIGEIPDENGVIMTPFVTFLDVVQSVESQKGITELDVFINSVGGYVEEGNEMFAYLSGLRSKGIKVTTHAGDECMSIATKVFLSGEERFVNSNTEFMIHNPFGQSPEGDADHVELYYKNLRSIENDMISFYSKQTGTSSEAIKPLMKKETFLTPEQAVNLGFATSITENIPMKALAFSKEFKNNSNPKNKNKMSKDVLNKRDATSLVDKLLAGIKAIFPKALKTVQDAEGVDIVFPDLEENDTPEVGSVTEVKEGTFLMPSGETYVVADNAITEIIPVAEDNEDTEGDAVLQAKIDELTLQLEAANAQVTALKATEATKNTEIKNLEKGLLIVQRSIKSDFQHQSKGDKTDLDKGGEKSRTFMKD